MQGDAMGGLGAGLQRTAYGYFPCARLSNLPFDASEESVAHWLAGVVPLDIVILPRRSRHVSEAMVVLTEPMQLEIVLSRNQQPMGRNVVAVAQASKMDYYREIAGLLGELAPAEGGPHASAAGGMGAPALQMPLVPMPGGAPSPGSMQSALLGHAGGGAGALLAYGLPNAAALQHAGHAARPLYAQQHLGPQFAQPRQSLGPLDASAPSSMLKLRGLPFSASAQDIANWFNTGGNGMFNLSQESVYVLTNPNGRSNGQAFVEFPNPGDAEHAMFMDRQMFGNRYVELFISSSEEMQRATGAATSYY